MQRIRSTVDEKEQKQLLMDLDVVMRSSDCPYIVQFYGALFREVSWSSPTEPLHFESITLLYGLGWYNVNYYIRLQWDL